jgi:peptidoglycan-associated lipoprotein
MKLAFLPVAATALLLAACSSAPSEPDAAAGGGGITTTDTSGLNGSAAAGSQADLEQNVGDRVFFGFDSTTLDEQARATLQRQGTWLQQYPSVSATIEGHTDERGTREYNLALGERRANAAREYLTSRGISADRLNIVSYGEERPKHDNTREETRRLNRRAALTVRLTQ